jgi:hypothetical protein
MILGFSISCISLSIFGESFFLRVIEVLIESVTETIIDKMVEHFGVVDEQVVEEPVVEEPVVEEPVVEEPVVEEPVVEEPVIEEPLVE